MEIDSIKKFFDLIRSEGRSVLTEPEAKKVLAMAGIPIPREGVARDADEAVKLAQKIGCPVAMKIVSPQILHKSDSGAIRINVESKAIEEAYFEVVAKAKDFNPSARIDGVLIQEMLSSGIETILGVTTDDQFGPVILFGLGGIFVEVMEDVTFRIIPIDKKNAMEMLEEIRGKRILDGYRNVPRTDKERLIDVMLKLSDLSFCLRDDIQEIDINPLYCHSTEIKAMDALIVLKR